MVHQTINFKMFYLILAICFFTYYSSFSKEYNVDKSAKNIVKFISDAPMEDFEGITDKIDGYLINDDISNLKNSEFYFEVDLNSVKTGIALRDRHMREDYLNTAKPFAKNMPDDDISQFNRLFSKVEDAIKRE